jgi:hypothetical protein
MGEASTSQDGLGGHNQELCSTRPLAEVIARHSPAPSTTQARPPSPACERWRSRERGSRGRNSGEESLAASASPREPSPEVHLRRNPRDLETADADEEVNASPAAVVAAAEMFVETPAR